MLFVGDDWAEDRHDVALINEEVRLLARRRLSEGAQGIEGLLGLIGDYLDERDGPGQVMVGIDTDRVRGLRHCWQPITPFLQSIRYRQPDTGSGMGPLGRKATRAMPWC